MEKLDYPTDASYVPELEAMVRSVMLMPSTWNLAIVTDNEGVQKTAEEFPGRLSENQTRRKLGWQLLKLFLQVTEARTGTVTVVHQHSHRKLHTTRSVGNALADLKAEQARITEGAQPLPLEQQMGRFIIQMKGKLLIADIKKPLQMKAAERALTKWKKSRTQGEIVTQLPNAATMIRQYRKEVASSTGTLANIMSTAISKRSYDPQWKTMTKYCSYCSTVRGKRERNSPGHQERCWTNQGKRMELQEEMAETVQLWEPGWTPELEELATEGHKGTAWQLTRGIGKIANFYKGAKMTITMNNGNESRQAQQHKIYELAIDYVKTCEGKGTIPDLKEYTDTLSAVLRPDPKQSRAQHAPDSAARLGNALVGTQVIWDASWYLRPKGYQVASKIAAEQNLGALPLNPASVINRAFFFAPLTETRTISALGLARRLSTQSGSTTAAVGLVTLGPIARDMIQRKKITVIVQIPRGCIAMGGTQKKRKRNRKALAIVLLVGNKRVDFEKNTQRVALLQKWREQFCPKATTFPRRMMQELTGQPSPKVPKDEDWTKLLGKRMAWTLETPATLGILTNAGVESMQRIGASTEYIRKVKSQLLERLKAYTKDQSVKRTQVQETKTQDRRAEQEVIDRQNKEEDRVARSLTLASRHMQEAVARLLPDLDEDKGDNEAVNNMSREQGRVERTLDESARHMQDAMAMLLSPPDTAPQWTLSDPEADEAISDGENNTIDSDSDEPGEQERNETQANINTTDSDSEEEGNTDEEAGEVALEPQPERRDNRDDPVGMECGECDNKRRCQICSPPPSNSAPRPRKTAPTPVSASSSPPAPTSPSSSSSYANSPSSAPVPASPTPRRSTSPPTPPPSVPSFPLPPSSSSPTPPSSSAPPSPSSAPAASPSPPPSPPTSPPPSSTSLTSPWTSPGWQMAPD